MEEQNGLNPDNTLDTYQINLLNAYSEQTATAFTDKLLSTTVDGQNIITIDATVGKSGVVFNFFTVFLDSNNNTPNYSSYTSFLKILPFFFLSTEGFLTLTATTIVKVTFGSTNTYSETVVMLKKTLNSLNTLMDDKRKYLKLN